MQRKLHQIGGCACGALATSQHFTPAWGRLALGILQRCRYHVKQRTIPLWFCRFPEGPREFDEHHHQSSSTHVSEVMRDIRGDDHQRAFGSIKLIAPCQHGSVSLKDYEKLVLRRMTMARSSLPNFVAQQAIQNSAA